MVGWLKVKPALCRAAGTARQLPVMPVANSPSAALRAKAGTEAIVG